MKKIGIIGIPNVGKSSLFNLITNSYNAQVSNYPFSTITPNIKNINIYDDRLTIIKQIIKGTQKTIYAKMQLIDIAGLISQASKGKGLGSQFLSYIREMNVLLHVIRYFENENVINMIKKIDPIEEIDLLLQELILSDINIINKNLNKNNTIISQKILNLLKDNNIHELQRYVKNSPNNNKLLINELNLLTIKPIIYIINVNFVNNIHIPHIILKIKNHLKFKYNINNSNIISIPILLQNNNSEFINKIFDNILYTLNIKTFFTFNQTEIKAWFLKDKVSAYEASQLIHSSFQKKFIKVNVCSWKNFIQNNMIKYVLKNKNYIVEDGDILYFILNR